MIDAEFKLDKRFLQKAKARFERFEAEAGVLEDGPHYSPRVRARKGSMEGGPVRKKSGRVNGSLAGVGEQLRTVHRVPYLTAPFKQNRSKEMKELRLRLVELITGKAKSYSKFQTALRSLIRTPILKQKYGHNSLATARAKGFNRFLIDTGQFFRAITAKVRVRRVSK